MLWQHNHHDNYSVHHCDQIEGVHINGLNKIYEACYSAATLLSTV